MNYHIYLHFCFVLLNILVSSVLANSISSYDANTTLMSLIIDKSGHVFVGGEHVLLQFSDKGIEYLEQSLNTSCLDTDCQNNTSIARGVSILMLHTVVDTDDTEYLVFCGRYNTSCYVHSSSDISQYWPLVTESSLGSNSSAYAVSVPVSEHVQYPHIYSGVDTSGWVSNTDTPYAFSEKYVYHGSGRFQMAYLSHETNYIKAKQEGHGFQFVTGFLHQKYVYFLKNNLSIDGDGHHTYNATISQTCTSDQYFRSYIESTILCDGLMAIQSASIFQHAGKTYLVAIFFKGDTQLDKGSAICVFDADVLQTYFKIAKEKCFNQLNGTWPIWIDRNGTSCTQRDRGRTVFYCGESSLNTRILASDEIQQKSVFKNTTHIMTSVVMTTKGTTSIGYIGDSDGTISKVVFNSNCMESRTTVYQTNCITRSAYQIRVNEIYPHQTGSDEKIQNMALHENGNKLFFTYDSKVGMLRTDDCSLQSECLGCLADMLDCVWSVQTNQQLPKCIAKSVSESIEHGPENTVYTNYCPPHLKLVRPLAGPTAGGTLLTIEGIFSYYKQVQARVFIGLNQCNITEATTLRLVCRTSPVEDTDTVAGVTVEVLPTSTSPLDEQLYLHDVKYHGNATFVDKFAFQMPCVSPASKPPLSVKKSGSVPITFIGTNLHIGSDRRILVGDKPCTIDLVKNTSITCRAPAQDNTGSYKTEIKIDGAVMIGPNVTYLKEPVIENIHPLKFIVSGGINMTIRGEFLIGMGEPVYLNFSTGSTNVNTNRGICKATSKVMICKTGAAAMSDLPVNITISFYNGYGTMSTMRATPENTILTLVQDPKLEKVSATHFLGTGNHTLTFKGSLLSNVDKKEIRISIGSHDCDVTFLNDVSIQCHLVVRNNIEYGSAIQQIKVSIGFIVYDIGNAIFQRREPVPEGSMPGPTSADSAGVIVVCVIIGIVSAIGATVFITKRVLRKMRSRNDESYNVTFRRGNDILTLDGLSENNATDISDNRQNAYHEQTFSNKSSDDTTHVKETDPLLPVIDEETRISLERQHLLIDKNCLVLGEVIGQGHFGCVYKGYKRLPDEKQETLVAAKTLHRSNPKDLDVQMFLKEALIMKDFRHRNVMELVGICLGLKNLPLVILPYMRRGDLLSYLRDANNVPTVKDLVMFGVDIANGMHYLSQLKFVHRDLAARNCMIDDDLTVKVADFGLSRDVYEKEYYSSCDKTTKLPVKWMSPESLEFGMYSTKSDVWSYGVVLWELLTRGINPYPTVDNWEILRYLKEDRRLEQPRHCPDEMYSIMLRCWTWDVEQRLTFGQLTIDIPVLLSRLERPPGYKGKELNIGTTYVNFMANGHT